MRCVVIGILVAFAVPTRQGSAQHVTTRPPLDSATPAAAQSLSAGATPRGEEERRRTHSTLLAGQAIGVTATIWDVVGAAWPLPIDTVSGALPSHTAIPARDRAPDVTTDLRTSAPRRLTQSWWPPLASAILPGAGQGLLGQDRALAFLAVEGYGWLRYASDVREGRRQRNAYRALAAQVARAYLSDDSPIGDFEYYERMEHYIESGVFDTSPDEGVQPEMNAESFNGFIWLRARTTFWEDPAIPPPPASQPYFAALEYYADRAIGPQFRWSWRNAQLEQDLFRRTIGRSNDAFRRSIQDLGVIIANHALSTVDAYVTVRIRHAKEEAGRVGIEASIPWSPRLASPRAGDSPR